MLQRLAERGPGHISGSLSLGDRAFHKVIPPLFMPVLSHEDPRSIRKFIFRELERHIPTACEIDHGKVGTFARPDYTSINCPLAWNTHVERGRSGNDVVRGHRKAVLRDNESIPRQGSRLATALTKMYEGSLCHDPDGGVSDHHKALRLL
jgi:hypothetical protein